MKILFKSMVFALVFSFILSIVPFEGECKEISDKVFRVHILANSDSEEDQALKLKVRDAVIDAGEGILSGAASKDDAKRLVENNLLKLKTAALRTIYENGYDYPVSLEITNMYFDTRYYEDITMPGGFYDALRIKIGRAEGKNWWCVMFPSLCIYSASKTQSLEDNLSEEEYKVVSSKGEFEYKFKIVEVFGSICNFFKR